MSCGLVACGGFRWWLLEAGRRMKMRIYRRPIAADHSFRFPFYSFFCNNKIKIYKKGVQPPYKKSYSLEDTKVPLGGALPSTV
jgi:hypothetical protein